MNGAWALYCVNTSIKKITFYLLVYFINYSQPLCVYLYAALEPLVWKVNLGWKYICYLRVSLLLTIEVGVYISISVPILASLVQLWGHMILHLATGRLPKVNPSSGSPDGLVDIEWTFYSGITLNMWISMHLLKLSYTSRNNLFLIESTWSKCNFCPSFVLCSNLRDARK